MISKKGKSQVTFIYNPNDSCRRVELVGTFNGWQAGKDAMARQKDGTFRKRLSLPPGAHRYKFLVDGKWVEDPEAERLEHNAFGTLDSVVIVE